MNEKEIRFIDLFSGIGGFRRGLERANKEGGILRQPNMHRHCTDINECLKHGRDTSGRNISQEPNRSYRRERVGSERACLQDRGVSSDTSDTNGRTPYSPYRFKCVWSCDNDKYANQIYTKNFGEENHFAGDIRQVDPSEIPDFDLLCAGFPCQSFSVAGKRKGFKDTRGTLFFEILRIAKIKRPKLLLLENVKGLLSHDEGFTFQIILSSLEELGYWVEWQVLNSKHYGVPQNRERVFIVGHLGEGGGREIFPIQGDDKATSENGAVVRTLQGGALSGGLHSRMTAIPVLTPDRLKQRQDGRRFKEDGEESFTLTKQDIHGVAIYRHPFNYGKKAVYTTDEEYPALRTVQLSSSEPYIKNVSHGFNTGWKKPFPNLRAEGRSEHNELLVKGARIRRLTPTECERLQGFPDGWTKGISDTQRYKTLGNAITTNVAEFLGYEILEKCFGAKVNKKYSWVRYD